RQLLPSDCLSTAEQPAANTFGINEHREGVAEFFHDRPRDFVLRFQAVIEADHGASWRNIFLAALPSQQILHADNGYAAVLELFHLRLKCRWRDLGSGKANFLD